MSNPVMRESLMSRYLPMLSRSADGPFDGDEWYFEVKWDGVRAVAYVNDHLSLRSRNDRELAARFPELAELSTLAPHTVLDGEIVVMNEGRPDIQALLPRIQAGGPPPATAPTVTYLVFDILEKDKKPLINLPFRERRKILEASVREGRHVILSVPVKKRGEEYYKAAIARGLEGVMAKKMDSLYEPGIRSSSWLKIKAEKTCDCVIAGYTHGEGGRRKAFGALVLGLYDKPGRDPGTTRRGLRKKGVQDQGGQLVYIGKVGTGFSDRDLSEILKILLPLEGASPQIGGFDLNETVTWLEPVLVCEVAYQSVTRSHRLRIPRFIRLRPDRKAGDCSIEQLADVAMSTSLPHTSTTRAVTDKKANRADTGTAEPSHEGQPGGSTRGEVLEEYRKRRDFSVSSEPSGTEKGGGSGNYFVIHEHHARRLHFDLRLERDGVLKSWAVPKGMPVTSGEKHLAIGVEDHPMDYGHFEGTIPAGQYGAGIVSIWDNGSYETKHWDPDKIEITLHGHRLDAPFVLVRFRRAGKNEWLLMRAGQ